MEKTVVIIHAVRKEGLDTEFYNMEYTLPDYKCRKTEDGVKEVFKKAVTAWLTTAEGEKAYEDTMHDFNWLDIPNYIPDSWMSFYDIEKIKTGDRLTIGNPAVIVIEVNADETFDQNLI